MSLAIDRPGELPGHLREAVELPPHVGELLEREDDLAVEVIVQVPGHGCCDRVADGDGEHEEQAGAFEDVGRRRPHAEPDPRPEPLPVAIQQCALDRPRCRFIPRGREPEPGPELLADGQAGRILDGQSIENVDAGAGQPRQRGDASFLGALRPKVGPLLQRPAHVMRIDELGRQEGAARGQEDVDRRVRQERDSALRPAGHVVGLHAEARFRPGKLLHQEPSGQFGRRGAIEAGTR